MQAIVTISKRVIPHLLLFETTQQDRHVRTAAHACVWMSETVLLLLAAAVADLVAVLAAFLLVRGVVAALLLGALDAGLAVGVDALGAVQQAVLLVTIEPRALPVGRVAIGQRALPLGAHDPGAAVVDVDDRDGLVALPAAAAAGEACVSVEGHAHLGESGEVVVFVWC